MIQFHVDEDQSQQCARVAREHFGLDVSASHELGIDRATDDEQLTYAGDTGRCIVTRNAKDFEPLTRRFEREVRPHAGVLIVPSSMNGREFFRIARALAYFASLYPEGVPPYFVGYLQDPPEGWEPPHA